MDLASTCLLLLAGLAAGTVGSLLGVGGGMIVIPVLTTFFGFAIRNAAATSLLAVIATSSGVAVATGRERFVNPRLGVVLALPTTVLALAGGLLAGLANPAVLFGLFAAVLSVTAVLMWRPEEPEDDAGRAEDGTTSAAGPLDGYFRDPKTGELVAYRVRRLGGMLGISAAAGALSGMLGIGGGVFQVPAMTVVGSVPMRAATATSNFLLGITAVSSVAVYYGRGDVRPLESAAVVLGVLGGAFAGSELARRLHGRTLRRIFSAVLVLLAVQMARKAFA